MNVYLDKLDASVEKVGDEVVVHLPEDEVLGAVDPPGHVVPHSRVQTWKLLHFRLKCKTDDAAPSKSSCEMTWSLLRSRTW